MQSACASVVYMSVNWHRCDGPTLCTISRRRKNWNVLQFE